jgi:hypothetical protein
VATIRWAANAGPPRSAATRTWRTVQRADSGFHESQPIRRSVPRLADARRAAKRATTPGSSVTPAASRATTTASPSAIRGRRTLVV